MNCLADLSNTQCLLCKCKLNNWCTANGPRAKNELWSRGSSFYYYHCIVEEGYSLCHNGKIRYEQCLQYMVLSKGVKDSNTQFIYHHRTVYRTLCQWLVSYTTWTETSTSLFSSVFHIYNDSKDTPTQCDWQISAHLTLFWKCIFPPERTWFLLQGPVFGLIHFDVLS